MYYYVGEVLELGLKFSPRGCLPCNGESMSIAYNSVLFSLLGTTYGGDGRTFFNLPDLRGKSDLDASPTDCHFHICVEGIYPPRP